MSELKACPFCGGEAIRPSDPRDWHLQVSTWCKKGKACPGGTESHTIAAWNTRVPAPSDSKRDGVVEALELAEDHGEYLLAVQADIVAGTQNLNSVGLCLLEWGGRLKKVSREALDGLELTIPDYLKNTCRNGVEAAKVNPRLIEAIDNLLEVLEDQEDKLCVCDSQGDPEVGIPHIRCEYHTLQDWSAALKNCGDPDHAHYLHDGETCPSCTRLAALAAAAPVNEGDV